MDEVCAACESKLERRYIPMREWNMKGPLCGGCYSRLIAEFYPGDHVRMGSQHGGGADKAAGAGAEAGGGQDSPKPQEAAPDKDGCGDGCGCGPHP